MSGLRDYWSGLGRDGKICLLVILGFFASTYFLGNAPRVSGNCEITWDGRSNSTICN